uniref:hypothetical protein n=1 Tax=Ningiella ruwaisensis TaxID=2364274 RepID=UPI00109FC984|nr:hypothetical protein [Ningiella ruwaisensis]
MATYNKFNVTMLDMATKKHDFENDTYKFMLTNSAPAATDAVKSDITEISAGNGYTAGGSVIGTSATQVSGTLSVSPSGDVTITASGGAIGPFRHVVLYNDTTAGKPLVSHYDYGSSITLNNGENFVIDVGSTLFTAS